jgi:hypothetical protein
MSVGSYVQGQLTDWDVPAAALVLFQLRIWHNFLASVLRVHAQEPFDALSQLLQRQVSYAWMHVASAQWALVYFFDARPARPHVPKDKLSRLT